MMTSEVNMQTIKVTMSQHAVERVAERFNIKASVRHPMTLSGYRIVSQVGAVAKLVYAHLVFVVDMDARHVLTVYAQ